VFGAPQNAVLLETADPHGRLLAHPHRVGAEGARLDDRVLGLEIEIAHGANAQLIPTERASVPVIIPQVPVASRSSSQPSAAGGGSSVSP